MHKGIEMKLIHILMLVALLAAAAMAQNSGASGQAKPTPSPAATTSQGAKAQSNPASPANASGASVSGQKPSAANRPLALTGVPGNAAKPGATASNQAATGKAGAPAVTASPSIVKGGAAPSIVKQASPSPVTAQAQTVKARPKKGPIPVLKANQPEKTSATAKGAGKPKRSPFAKPASVEKKAATPAIAPGADKTAASAASKPIKASAAGRRDPFVSPVRAVVGAPAGPGCSTGKRCLYIPELTLQGTVKDLEGKMMAVVANTGRRVYFLRENDQVFNGVVEKITTDSVIFRQYETDAVGRETSKEIVKRLGPVS